MKHFISILFLFACLGTINSQVCASLSSWSELGDNGDGTCDYSLSVIVDSGNGASGTATFSESGNVVHVEPSCICNPTTITFTVTVACGSTIDIDVHYDAPGNGNDCTGSTGSIILPIHWINLSANNEINSNNINWTVIEDVNHSKYQIERSRNGLDFDVLSEIETAGRTDIILDYSFRDEEPINGLNYYRIKQIDFDGNYTYSETLTVQHFVIRELMAYPNPFDQTLFLKKERQSEWTLYDSFGKEVKNGTEGFISTSELPSGIYYLRIFDDIITAEQILVKNQ